MRCELCSGQVAGQRNIVILDRKGPAHQDCYEQYMLLNNRRMFKGILLSELLCSEIAELKEAVLTEENSRRKVESVVELF